jgi:hypothetical protein
LILRNGLNNSLKWFEECNGQYLSQSDKLQMSANQVLKVSVRRYHRAETEYESENANANPGAARDIPQFRVVKLFNSTSFLQNQEILR